MTKLIVLIVFAILLIPNLNASIGTIRNRLTTKNTDTIKISLEFNKPIIKNGEVILSGATSQQNAFRSSMPDVSKTFLFPPGTKIKNISFSIGNISENSAVLTTYTPFPLGRDVYTGKYPSKWLEYDIGRGINNGKPVIILSIHVYPVTYNRESNEMHYIDGIKIKIDYEKHDEVKSTDIYDLLIIAPSEFSDALQPLIDEKENHGMKTMLVTLDEIYNGNYFHVRGRDEPEKIKYFIKDAVEQWGIKYVLLVGSATIVPIRATLFSQKWHNRWWNETVLTDLYYADIYDANGSFSSWDSNNNGIFGERYYGSNGEGMTNDTMDLYPDVYVGRLACKNIREVKNVVGKIIEYENEKKPWFRNMLLAGGDTFPGWDGYEGEEEIEKVRSIMSEFNATELKTSDGSFGPAAINRAINGGVGFFYYSGHGFAYGLGTHPPNNDSWIYYLDPYMMGMRNGGKLPVVLFDACLTSKLDFTFGDLINDTGPSVRKMLSGIANITGTEDKRLECFSWKWVAKSDGGAIATIGATRVSFRDIGTYFFRQYEDNDTLGEIFSNFESHFISEVGKDYYTTEEFILLGDPSMIVG